MGEDHEQGKRSVRRELRVLRRALPPDTAAAVAAAICKRAAALSLFATAGRVVLYAAIENEVDPSDLGDMARAAGKRTYYPRMTSDGLEFLEAERATLEPGKFGVPEPCAGAPIPRDAGDALIVVPGVAYDLRGARLGRGEGWYDAALSRRPEVARIGLAYEFQIVPVLPVTERDIWMDAVVTEGRLLACGARAVLQ